VVALTKQLNLLLGDAMFFSDRYVTPATDAAVYQASSGWITSPKKVALWDVQFGLHANVFMTPHKDLSFLLSNSDLKFFQIQNASSTQIPTALGDKSQVLLTGELQGEPVNIKTPQGMDMQVVSYPYLQASVG
jgi:hypothetical protein